MPLPRLRRSADYLARTFLSPPRAKPRPDRSRNLGLEVLEARVLLSFAPPVTYPVGGQVQSVAVGDFRDDGKEDLVAANTLDGTVSVLLGNGDGTFQPQVTYATGAAPIGIAVGDLTGNGKQDLVVANAQSNTVSVLLGNGDGTFQPAVNYPVPGSPGAVVIGDFNGDGIPDLAVLSPQNHAVDILLGNGDGTFQAGVAYNVGSYTEGLAAGDFTGSGKLDLVAGCANNVSVLIGNGDGTFQPYVSYATGSRTIAVAVADFNHDGKLDIAAASYNDSNVSILLGNGDGTFQPAVAYPVDAGPSYTMAVADFNGDGNLDLVTANYTGNDVSLLLGNGDGTFQPAQNYSTGGANAIAVATGDFNGDCGPDLAVANNGSNTVGVLLNVPTLSRFNVTAPPTTTAGSPLSVTVTAFSQFNCPLTTYTGTVHFTSSDPKAVLPADYTFTAANQGRHTFKGVKLKTAGSQTITATDTASGTITGQGTVTVNPASASHLRVTAPSKATAGTPFTITVTALDPYGNVATGYTGTVHFTSSDSQATLPADYPFTGADDGTHTFTDGVTLRSTSKQTVKATDTLYSTITGKATVKVVTGAAPATVAPTSSTGPAPVGTIAAQPEDAGVAWLPQPLQVGPELDSWKAASTHLFAQGRVVGDSLADILALAGSEQRERGPGYASLVRDRHRNAFIWTTAENLLLLLPEDPAAALARGF